MSVYRSRVARLTSDRSSAKDSFKYFFSQNLPLMRIIPLLLVLLLPLCTAFPGFSPVQKFSLSSQHLAFGEQEDSQQLTISVQDDAIYFQGWYSLDGQEWQDFNFDQPMTNGWITGGTATKTLPIPKSSSEDNYIIVYSCTKSATTWNCHSNQWQIIQFNTSVEQQDAFDIRGKIKAAVGLIHDQEFVIPENSVNGDTAGQLNRMWLDYFDQHVTYAIVGGDGTFSIDGDGTISVTDASGLDYPAKPVHQLAVRATETSTGETSEATITIKLTDCDGKTFFVNPDCSSEEGCCGEGTRACPYATWYDALGSWGQNPIAPGTAYLQKRGSVASESLHSIQNGTASAHIIFGAYGSGPRPVLDGSYTASKSVRGIYPGSFSNPVMHLDFYSFEVRDFPSTGFTKPPNSHHVTITDLYVHDNGNRPDVAYDEGHQEPGIYLWEMSGDQFLPVNDVVRDTVMINNHEHGVKTTGGSIRVDFSYAEGNGGNGFSCPASRGINYTNSIAIGNDGSGFKLQCNDMHVENDVSERNYVDGYMDGNYYVETLGDGRFGFNVQVVNVIAAHNIGEGFIFQDNVEGSTIDGLEAYNNSHGIWARHESNNNVIKNSKIYNNFLSGIYFSNYMNGQGTRDTHGYTVQDNLIYDNGFIDDGYPRVVDGAITYKGYSGNSWCTIYPAGDYTHMDGYYFYDEPSGIDIEDAYDIRIVGNRIYNTVGENFVPVRTTTQSSGIVQTDNVFE